MVSCFAAAQYIYKVDIQVMMTETNEETGQVEAEELAFLKTVPGYVYPYLEGGIRGMGTGERFDEKYANTDYLRIKTSLELDKSWRVTNIRKKRGGQVVYQEQITGLPTVYNVDGSAPLANPLTGNIDEWVSTLSRSEIQA